jgi:uncharacterized protein involved in exopolysaccharide biosynthesis
MATREITKRDSRYMDPELEHELAVEAENSALSRERRVARLALLWRERGFLYRCAGVGIVLSTIIAFLLPVRYTSTTRLMPPDQAGAGMATMLSALTKAGGDLGALGSDLLGIRTSSDLFVGVLHSRTIQDRLVNKFDLRKVYGDRRWEDARKDLEDRTDVSADRKSGIITIKVSDKDQHRAAQLAREYVAGLDQIVLTLNISSAHKERIFLEKRLGQVQEDLEAAEKDFGNFASKNTAIDVKEQGKAMLGAAAEVEGQLIAAQTELEGLRQIYTSNNVRVRSTQARIDELRRQLQKLGGQAQSADSAAPTGNDDDSYPSIRKLPILGVTYADLFRRAKVQEAIFETLTKQYELAKVEEARETPSVKVLDEGDVPEKKSFPPRLLVVFLGTVFAFALGATWLSAAAKWEQVDPDSPGKILAQDVLQTFRSSLPGNHRRSSADSRVNPKDAA